EEETMNFNLSTTNSSRISSLSLTQTAGSLSWLHLSQHNSLDLYLLSLTKYCDDIFESKLEELINQLREGDEGWMNG
ncbi:unnamed protein product, partial [Thlaspi arvense]